MTLYNKSQHLFFKILLAFNCSGKWQVYEYQFNYYDKLQQNDKYETHGIKQYLLQILKG